MNSFDQYKAEQESFAFSPLSWWRRGFSLLEIVIVLGIVVVLLAISIPAWRHYALNLKLREAADGVVADLKLAQQRTVSEQIVYTVKFYADTESYSVIRFNPDQENPGSYVPETLSTQKLDAEIDLVQVYEFSIPEVRFTAAGGVVEGGQVELQNRNGEGRVIDVRPSGFIQIYQRDDFFPL